VQLNDLWASGTAPWRLWAKAADGRPSPDGRSPALDPGGVA